MRHLEESSDNAQQRNDKYFRWIGAVHRRRDYFLKQFTADILISGDGA